MEPRNHFTGNVLRNETETYSQISGMEGNLPQRFASGSTGRTAVLIEASAPSPPCPLSCVTVPHRPLTPMAADAREPCRLTVPRLRPGMDGLDKMFECLFLKKQA